MASKKFTLPAALLVSLLWAGAANAAFTTGGYCVGGPPNATDGVSTDDVTLNGSDSSNCYGVVDIGGDIENEIGNINDLGWGDYNTTNFLKDDSAAGSVSDSFLGLNWTLAADNGSGSGNWTLTVVDPNPGTAPDLPITIDIIAFMKAGQPGAFFFFDDVVIDLANTGVFSISWKVGGGPSGGNTPGLSGFSLFFGEPTSRVPEPGSIALLGLALAGLGLATRRRA